MIVSDFGVFCHDCGDNTLTATALPEIKNSIRYRIENSGQTPASDVTTITNWWPEPGKGATLPRGFGFPDHKQISSGFISKSDIGRDKHKDSAGEIEAKDIPTFKDAVDGRTTLFLYGHVDYCDIFKVPRSTAYCFVYVPNGGLHLPLCESFNGEIPPRHEC
jgi:hypothetical protein